MMANDEGTAVVELERADTLDAYRRLHKAAIERRRLGIVRKTRAQIEGEDAADAVAKIFASSLRSAAEKGK